MSYNVTAADARTISTSDSVIYNEIDYITRQIIAASLLGELEVSIDDGSLMTESTPTITVQGTDVGVGSVFTPGQTVIIAGTTITLSSGAGFGTGIDQAVSDINTQGPAGLVASRLNNTIVLSYQAPQATWSLTLAEGTGTALVDLGFTAGTTAATDPESVDYYGVWSGSSSDRKKSFEYSQVVNHFQNLGYNILAKQNTVTGNTFLWEAYW